MIAEVSKIAFNQLNNPKCNVNWMPQTKLANKTDSRIEIIKWLLTISRTPNALRSPNPSKYVNEPIKTKLET